MWEAALEGTPPFWNSQGKWECERGEKLRGGGQVGRKIRAGQMHRRISGRRGGHLHKKVNKKLRLQDTGVYNGDKEKQLGERSRSKNTGGNWTGSLNEGGKVRSQQFECQILGGNKVSMEGRFQKKQHENERKAGQNRGHTRKVFPGKHRGSTVSPEGERTPTGKEHQVSGLWDGGIAPPNQRWGGG